MLKSRGMFLVVVGALLTCTPMMGTADTAPAANATAPQRHVVGAAEIQASIDAQVAQEDADRQVIQHLLQRSEVRQLATSAGLDIQRATASASVLSGQQLKDVAAQARVADQGLGGAEKVTLTYTLIIIILLVIVILIVA